MDSDPDSLPSSDEFLGLLWSDLINSSMCETWIDATIASGKRDPNGPFGDMGPVLERLLATGASRRDLSLLSRMSSYEAVFGTLSLLADPGVDVADPLELIEGLLGADPSGLEAGPGSAPSAENG